MGKSDFPKNVWINKKPPKCVAGSKKGAGGRKLMGLPAEKWWAVFILHTIALSRGTPCRRACVADRRGRRQAPSFARTDGKNKKEHPVFLL